MSAVPGRESGPRSPSEAGKLTRRQRAELRAARPTRVLIDDFERLLAEFATHVHAARKLKVTDPRHDALTRVALRGFTLSSKVFKWHAPHYLYVQRYARTRYEGVGDGPVLFFCLCAGYALGLAEEDALGKHEFRAAEQHLDAVIRLNLAQIREGFEAGMKLK